MLRIADKTFDSHLFTGTGKFASSQLMVEISCRMATRSCFFRLLQGVEMLRIADKTFDSHLFTGTGKFASSQLMVEAIRASGSQLVTLAMKRVDLRQHNDAILEPLIAAGVTLLPNTSGAKTAEEAIFAAHLAREALGTNWLKLEIHPDARWLLPDPIETLKAAETLVQQGFVVLPYCGADPVLCKRLEEVGCAAVMPLGAPIGSNQGLETRAITAGPIRYCVNVWKKSAVQR